MASAPAAISGATTEATGLAASHGIGSVSTRDRSVGALPMIHGEFLGRALASTGAGLPKSINGPTTGGLHAAAVALQEPQQREVGASPPTLAVPVLAGRKRSQPTGGWSARGGVDESREKRVKDAPEAAQSRKSSGLRSAAAAAAAAAAAETAAVAAAAAAVVSTAVAALPPPPQVDGADILPGDDASADSQALGDEASLPPPGEPQAEPAELEGAVIDDGSASSPKATGTELAVDSPIIVEEKELPVSCLGDFKFTFAEVNKMCKRYPTLNTLGAETAMPLLGWLTRELDMGLGDMRNLVLRHPRLMAYRVTSHVAPKTKWLRERLGLGQPQLRKLITTYPAVLSRSVEENLEPKFKWLEERLEATPEEVQVLIKRFPLIFGYSTSQNLEPTVAFFTEDMSGGLEEIKAAVMSCPSILSRSLDKRIMPRAQQMRDKEIEPRFGPHKWVVSTYTDAQFNRWLDGRGT